MPIMHRECSTPLQTYNQRAVASPYFPDALAESSLHWHDYLASLVRLFFLAPVQDKELEECTFTPRVNSVSRRAARSRRQALGENHLAVDDRLYDESVRRCASVLIIAAAAVAATAARQRRSRGAP